MVDYKEEAPGGKKSEHLGNHTYTTEAGHVIEIDNTPGDCRIHVYHKSGTFIEIKEDGAMITKVEGKTQEFNNNGRDQNINGNFNITVKGNVDMHVTGNFKQEVGGDYELITHGDYRVKSKAGHFHEVGGDQRVQVNGVTSHRSSGDRDETTGGTKVQSVLADYYSSVGGEYQQNISTDASISAGGQIGITAGGQMGLGAGEDMGIASAEKITIQAALLEIQAVNDLTINSDLGPTLLTVQETTGVKVKFNSVTTTETTYVGQDTLDGTAGPATPKFHSP